MTTASAPVVAHNRFPVRVLGPCSGGTGPEVARTARVVVTVPDGVRPARLLVWARPGEPAVDAAIDLDASGPLTPRGEWALVTDAGDYVVLPGRGGCCGHPLRRWQPFDPMIMSVLPK